MTLTDIMNDYDKALALCLRENPDLKSAYDLLVRCSEKGDPRATYALASWYLFGNEIVQKDEEHGILLIKTLENSNISEALFDLAVAYDYGKGVRKNSKRAFSLYMRAALLGDLSACDQIAQYYAEGKIVAADKRLSQAWALRSKQNEKDISPTYRISLG